MSAFSHEWINGNMSLLTIHRPQFTDPEWADFQLAHQQAYAQLARFHFILDIRQVNPSQCSHIWAFAQYLSGPMKERSERQVASIYIVNNHTGLLTRTIENVMRWYRNTIQLYFVDSVESAIQHHRDTSSCA
jgi:hypothetical protein